MTTVLFVGLATATKNSNAVTLQFNELPEQTLDGLSFGGVTFGFEIGGSASADASFGMMGPGTLTYLQDEILEGNANGVLTLDFAAPQNELSFGLGFLVFQDLMPAATVSLFDGTSNLLFQDTVDTHTLIDFSEGSFAYNSGAFSRAVISFNSAGDRFALDNLTFNSTAVQPVPEAGLSPWMVNAFFTTLLGVGTLRHKRRHLLNG